MNVFVVPCFNEERRWDLEYWREMQRVEDVTWLVVDDGSTDATASVAEDARGSERWHVVRLATNAGKAEAVRQGLLRALEFQGVTGVGFMDADRAFSAGDVERLCHAGAERFVDTPRWDAVWSSRVKLAGREIHRSPARHYVGRAVATFLSAGGLDLPYDTQSGLKLFVGSRTLSACLSAPFSTRWLFEVELLIRWRTQTGADMRVWEEPLLSWVDVPGSKISGAEVLRVAYELGLIKVLLGRARRTTTSAAG